MAKKKNTKEEKSGIAESFVENIPFVGGFFRELAKTEAFKERFKEVNKKIGENLEKGHKKEWNMETRISVRPLREGLATPLMREVQKETSEIEIGKDYFYGKKGDKLILAVKAPKDANLKILGKDLIIESGKSKRKIALPDYFKDIKKNKYENKVWLLELTK